MSTASLSDAFRCFNASFNAFKMSGPDVAKLAEVNTTVDALGTAIQRADEREAALTQGLHKVLDVLEPVVNKKLDQDTDSFTGPYEKGRIDGVAWQDSYLKGFMDSVIKLVKGLLDPTAVSPATT